MITSLLFYSTLDFAIFVLGAFVFFSTGLLFLDSWKLNKSKITPLIRGIGFFGLAIVYLIYASVTDIQVIVLIAQIIKTISLMFICLSLIKEPVLSRPDNSLKMISLPFMLPVFSHALIPFSAALTIIIFLLYLRRSTQGVDKQLKSAAIAFFLLSFAEISRILFAWSDTTNVFWSKVLAVHGLVWNTQMLLQITGIVILGLWVWGYIRFRVQIQIFVTILASTLVIFLTTTFMFSFLLLKNLENDALSHLKTDVQVLEYSLDRLQLESLSHARAIAADSSLKTALSTNNKTVLYDITSESLLSQNLASVVVASTSGEVLMRAENKDDVGDSIATDALVQSALSGQQLSTLVIDDMPLTPNVFVKSAVPVKDSSSASISGVVVTGFIIDSAFVDGVKTVTGLDATVFAGNKRSATTIVAPDGKSRFTGALESNDKILSTVLEKSNSYVGSANVFNEPYYTAYTPLKMIGDKTIGMLFMGKPQVELLETAKKSISLTFLGSVLLMLAAIIPAVFISKYIQENIEA